MGSKTIGAAAFLLLTLASVAMAAGKAEANGWVGTTKPCFTCHGSGSSGANLLGARQEYDVSGHKTRGNSIYANGGGCQVCHTNEGFIQSCEGQQITASSFVATPSQPGCFTCHDPHERGDLSLRTVAPVKLASGATFDSGNGNLCATCHHATAAARDLVVPTAANTITPSWGAHQSPQADIVEGTNLYEFPGKKYSSSAHKDVIPDGCLGCHMALPRGRYGFNSSVGGHSFTIVGQVEGAVSVNTAGCISCHKDLKAVPGSDAFDIIAQEDYDHNGVKEPVQVEVAGLLSVLVNAQGTGLLQRLDPPFYKSDGSFNEVTSTAKRPALEIAAFYNYRMIADDRSRGIHNAKYVIQVLYDTIHALNPQFDVSRRPQ
ncbi:MAG TPA: hypothetical protein VFH83_13580 [Spirochaetia bacterium]|nr:hypothetical protein [Spirochaetia bacterium]